MSRKSTDPSYSLTGFERSINAVVEFIFFYRMIIFILAIIAIVILGVVSWNNSPSSEKVRNLSSVLTCGSIIIGIFYAVLNYEINYFKYKREKIHSKKLASFHIASEWHKEAVVKNLKITKKLYEQHKHLIEENKSKEFSELLDNDEEARSALVSIFNYMECIALGIDQDIHDELFMMKFFRSVFVSYLNDYDFYIQYRRKRYNNAHIWVKFTELAFKWRSVGSPG